MRNVTVDRDDFLVEVIANREAHREVFEEALEGYHNRLKAELTHAFAAPDETYQSLTAAEVIARNQA